MRSLAGFCLILASTSLLAAPKARPRDPVSRNIGVTCKWNKRCMAHQRTAMRLAMNYLATARPPGWKLQVCNRNASRGVLRVDWIGFNNCIRNPALPPPAALPKPKKKFRIF